MKLLFCLIGFLVFYYVRAEQNNKTQELAEELHQTGLQQLTFASKALSDIKLNGYDHLNALVKHHVEAMQQLLSYLRVKFLSQGNEDSLNKTYLVNALAIDMLFVEHQISNEIDIVQEIEKIDFRNRTDLTKENLVTRAEHVIKMSKQSLSSQANSREYSLIQQEVKNVEHFVQHLSQNVSLSEDQLIIQGQALAQYEMSLHVLVDKAKWRLPCQLDCHPTSNPTPLQITDPVQVAKLIEIFQQYQANYEKKINQSNTKQAQLEKDGHGNLTSALAYQILLKKMFLANIKSQLAVTDKVFTKQHIQVIMEDSVRLDKRITEEIQIVDDLVMMVAPSNGNETNHQQLLDRANLLLKTCKDFMAKHEHSIEVPEIENEMIAIEAIITALNERSDPKEDAILNVKIGQQLDRHQTSVHQLIDQAEPKFD